MHKLLFLLALVSHFETAHAGFVKSCSELFMDPVTQKFSINYKTQPVTTLNGRNIILSPGPGPMRLETSLMTKYILTTNPRETNHYTELISRRQRIRNPVQGGQFGLGISEQWAFFIKSQAPQIIRDLIEFHRSQFSEAQLEILKNLVAVVESKSDLVMVDDSSQFEMPGNPHRISRTSGNLGEPIFINARMLQDFEVHAPAAGEDGYIKSNTTAPFDDVRVPPLQVHFATPEEFIKKVTHQADIERLAGIASVLFHEWGHYLKIKDDAEKTLDQLGTQVAKVLTERMDEVTLGEKNHPWLKYIHLGTKNSRKNGRLLLFDSLNMFDLTDSLIPEIKKTIKLEFTEYSITNLKWEEDHTVDIYQYTSPDVLNVDFIAHTQQGDIKVPLRIVNYFAAPVSNHPFVIPEAPWKTRPVQLKIEAGFMMVELQVMKNKITKANEISSPKITDWIAQDKKSYKPGETWKVTAQLELDSHDIPTAAQILFNSSDMANSGFIKRSKIPFEKIKIEAIGAKKILVHGEFTIPPAVKSGTYSVARIDLTYRDQHIEEYEPNQVEEVEFEGAKTTPQLNWVGVNHFMFESPTKVGPRPKALLRLDEVEKYPIGATVPIMYEFENLGAIKKISLHGRVEYPAQGYGQIDGFHIDVLGGTKSPFIHKIERAVKGTRQQIIVYLNIPKIINNTPIEALFIDSIYALDENLNEVFSPSPIGFGILVH